MIIKIIGIWLLLSFVGGCCFGTIMYRIEEKDELSRERYEQNKKLKSLVSNEEELI